MARSFVKWAGGKFQLLDEINDIIDSMTDECEEFIYVEPFVGGGALLFDLLERKQNLRLAFINDMNSNLVKSYKVIKSDTLYPELKKRLTEYQEAYNKAKSPDDRKRIYLDVREAYNKRFCTGNDKDDVECASMFIFLNKTAFNGIYRENSKGEFNVPWNQREEVNLFDEENLDTCHNLLKKVVMLNKDYKDTDFVMQIGGIDNCKVVYYLDPPYRPLEGSNSFIGYTKSGFSDKDQVRLKNFCDEINRNGYDFVLSNSKSGDFFENLYDVYEIDTVGARRNINSVGDKRGEVDELIIYNRKKKNVSISLF